MREKILIAIENTEQGYGFGWNRKKNNL
jgi:hypothetical protein